MLAVDRKAFPSGGDVFPRIAQANGGDLPVTEFLIHDIDPYDVLQRITHVFELRLRTRGTIGLPIKIVRQGDVPEQGA